MTTLFLSAVRVKCVHGKRKTGKHVNVRKQLNLTVTVEFRIHRKA